MERVRAFHTTYLSNLYRKIEQYYSILLVLLVLLLAVLLFRNPFSERTLIPNFEPFPDTFHYIVPVRNFLAGDEFLFAREGREPYAPSVPPFYSLTLLPMYMVNNDPRSFYFVNLLLVFASFFLFERILTALLMEKPLRLLLLFLLVTSFYFSWVPSLAMAENLLLPLLLSGILLLTRPISKKSVLLAGLLSWAFFATKFAAAPVTVIFSVLYLWKIWRESLSMRAQFVVRFIGASVGSYSVFALFEYWQKGSVPLLSLLRELAKWFGSVSDTASGDNGLSPFFSVSNIPAHWPLYFSGLLGEPVAFLWKTAPVILSFVAILGSAGILLNLWRGNREGRWFSAAVFLLILGQLTFMSTFYVVDMRFLYPLSPLLLLGLGWFIQTLWERRLFQSHSARLSLLALLFITASLLQLSQLKSQVILNLKSAETPWYAISVQQTDSYLAGLPETPTEKEPLVLISAIDPYLIDFYKTGNYTVIPLSEEQNHTPELWPQIWGEYDYSDFVALYSSFLNQGREVYAQKYGLGNVETINADWDRLEENFTLTVVQTGCFELCNLYRVTEKAE